MFRNIHNDSVKLSKTTKEYFGCFWILFYIPSCLFIMFLCLIKNEIRNAYRGRNKNVTQRE